jgi:hypothetical protein
MSGPASGWEDEHIHAFVDGELDAAQAAQLERDSHDDPLLARRIEQQRALRARLRQEFDPVLDEAAPQRLLDALNTGSDATITPIGAARVAGRAPYPRASWSYREWGALAATLVLGLLAGSRFPGPGSGLPIASRGGQLTATGRLEQALSTEVSAAPEDYVVQIGLTVRTAGGGYCRTFRLTAQAAGLACRRKGQWIVDILSGPTPSDAGDTYRQAASSVAPAVITALERAGAGEPLTAAQERALIQSGWDGAP